MKRTHRKWNNEISSGSMADIAFLLLIFFLVSTTIEQDQEILVKLPPYEKDNLNVPKIADRNIYRMMLSKDGSD